MSLDDMGGSRQAGKVSECEWTLLACTRLLSASSWSGQIKRLPGVRCTVPSFAISVVAHLDNQRGWGVEGEDPGLASRACMKTLSCLQCWSHVVDISKPLMLFCCIFPVCTATAIACCETDPAVRDAAGSLGSLREGTGEDGRHACQRSWCLIARVCVSAGDAGSNMKRG